MFPTQQQGQPPCGPDCPGCPACAGGMSAGTPPGFAGSLGQDPMQAQAQQQIDPQLVQLLLMQLQNDGLEGGMRSEAQAMIPLDPTAGMTGLSSQMPGMVPGMGMTPGMPGGMGGMGMPGGIPGGNLPPAFAAAQQLSAQRPQSASPY